MPEMAPAARAEYLARIKAELTNDPAGRGYAAAATNAAKAALLNAPIDPSFPNPEAGWADTKHVEAALMQAQVGATEFVVWDLVQAAQAGDPNPLGSQFTGLQKAQFRRVYRWLTEHPQINLLSPATQALLAGLVTSGILTQAQADAVKALGQPATLTGPRQMPRLAIICGYGDSRDLTPIGNDPDVPGSCGPPNAASAKDVADALAL